ncbi:hypothetical protein ERJ75_000111700 [Trypanosoma vivax]|uniref:Uncharacterized protein n=1 Tax=Trypanosoma vivax (strain Y486) TaxID=1055687 RepID=F9WQY3_TRYVY|nr:hypothetical protein TRVL_08841 [Trypanosoma vivax]KAH8619969.1 hypothetical protein ERJ75_000111700 [Trypanosoma vivax]CCD19965.1 hypothetical protein, conserved [Trypanosoma vivax Y486]|eukprot:CCD19965.1 hypothetical protein, conserved [Trypanosoma vivax Y486]
MTALIGAIAEEAQKQFPLLSFGNNWPLDCQCLFVTAPLNANVLTGCCLTGVREGPDLLQLEVAPVLLRFVPLVTGLCRSTNGVLAISPEQWDSIAVALVDGLPSVRLQAMSSAFPQVDGEGHVTPMPQRESVQCARDHMQRLCAFLPRHMKSCLSLCPSSVSVWFVVSYPGLEAVPDICLFILPDTLLVKSTMLQVGRKNISPHKWRAVADDGLQRVQALLQQTKVSDKRIIVDDIQVGSCVELPFLTPAVQLL